MYDINIYHTNLHLLFNKRHSMYLNLLKCIKASNFRSNQTVPEETYRLSFFPVFSPSPNSGSELVQFEPWTVMYINYREELLRDKIYTVTKQCSKKFLSLKKPPPLFFPPIFFFFFCAISFCVLYTDDLYRETPVIISKTNNSKYLSTNKRELIQYGLAHWIFWK